ncbi:MAG TPA: hypothetical protein ENK09_07625 [Nitrospirae bacterium]|nr:hypothetical protein [Nitrospirota bacterium]
MQERGISEDMIHIMDFLQQGRLKFNMLKCPFCDNELNERTDKGWICSCGELIPFGLETDTSDNCDSCPVLNCPRRK